MKSTTKKAMNEAIDMQIEQAAKALSDKYPQQDVELMLIERLLKKRPMSYQRLIQKWRLLSKKNCKKMRSMY